ncbi:2'-5' RNA ligase family protein [Sphingomonas sp. PB4P5]|uniref:2'-5' RNA ligase family protein n=1 Tax=Parasphingomonas puruogangriensis TaxID=3096155 RepID=UPI002FC75082
MFFAVRPPAGVIPEIAKQRDSFGQKAGLVPDEQLHLTTWLFEDSQDFLAETADRAQAAIASMPLRRFHVVFDRALGRKSHVMLLPTDPLCEFESIQRQLDLALRAAGLRPRADWRFHPHMTLLHGRQKLDQAILPIGWEVDELLLLDSVVGACRHDVIARWPLAPNA